MQYRAYSFFIFQYVFSFLKGFGYGVVVQKTTLDLSANTLFGIFLQLLKSFSRGKYYTANSFVADVSGVILAAPIH